MQHHTETRISPRRAFIAAAIIAAMAIPASVSNSAAQNGVYGLWRDQTGGLWCGGTCGLGQKCCTMSPLNPVPPA